MDSLWRKLNSFLLIGTLFWSSLLPHAYGYRLPEDSLRSAQKNAPLPLPVRGWENAHRDFLDLRHLLSSRRVERCKWYKVDCHAKRVAKEVGRGAKKVGKVVEEVAEGTIKGAGDALSATVNLVEAASNLATGDKDSAERAMRRFEDNGRNAVRNYGKKVVGSSVEFAADLLIDAPILSVAIIVDAVSGNDSRLRDEYRRANRRVSREIRKGSQKIGRVLEVAIQPENLAKIALIYVATSFAGPAGAAFVNVLYDKMVLQKNMSDEDMLKSFAIGLAAGYAAQGAQGLVENAGAVDTFRHASYLSKAASGVSHNLATDAGQIVLNKQGYSAKDFLTSLASGLSAVEMGDSFSTQVVESTLEGGLRSASTQSIENDLKINFDQVELAIYQGLGTGFTRESVHALLDITGITAAAQESGEQVKRMVFNLFISSRMKEMNAFLEQFQNAPSGEREKILQEINQWGISLREEVARELWGKNFAELTRQQVESINFQEAYAERLRAKMFDPEDQVGAIVPPIAKKHVMFLASRGHYATAEDFIKDFEQLDVYSWEHGGEWYQLADKVQREVTLRSSPYTASLKESEAPVQNVNMEVQLITRTEAQAEEALREVVAQVAPDAENYSIGQETLVTVVRDGREVEQVIWRGKINFETSAEGLYGQLKKQWPNSNFDALAREGGSVELVVERNKVANLETPQFWESGTRGPIKAPVQVARVRILPPGGTPPPALDAKSQEQTAKGPEGPHLNIPPAEMPARESAGPIVPQARAESEEARILEERLAEAQAQLLSVQAVSEQERASIQIGLKAVEVAREKLAQENWEEAEFLLELATIMAEVALGIMPYTGTFQDAYEFTVGLGLVTREVLSHLERSFAGLGLVIALGTGGVLSASKLRMGFLALNEVARRVDFSLFQHASRAKDLDRIGELGQGLVRTLGNLSPHTEEYLSKVKAAMPAMKERKWPKIAHSYEQLHSSLAKYVEEAGLPVAREYVVVRTTRQNQVGTRRVEDIFKFHPKNKTNVNRYSIGGAKGNEGIYGAIDSDGVSALETSRAEVDFEPHLAENFIHDTKNFHVKALDLTDQSVLNRLGLTKDEIKLDRNEVLNAYEQTQQIGDIAEHLGFEAIVYPSSKRDGGKAIVIFKEGILQ